MWGIRNNYYKNFTFIGFLSIKEYSKSIEKYLGKRKFQPFLFPTYFGHVYNHELILIVYFIQLDIIPFDFL